jgi:sulfane dehydrogenase subunit SoxC
MKRKQILGQPYPSNPDNNFLTRRELLVGGLASTALIMVQTAFGKIVPQDSNGIKTIVPEDPTKIQGPLPSVIGNRSPFEQPKRSPIFTSSRTPLQDLYGSITPSDLHFERHHGGIPLIDPNTYELLIHGMVEKPMIFSLWDLKRFPSVTRTCFIECSGNYRGNRENLTAQDIAGLTSQSEWTGVLLSTLLREVGVSPKATWFLAEGGDAAVMTRSIPVAKAWEDALIVYAQNGEAIRPGQGYPARLLLPGWEGNTSVKWLRRLEFSDQPFMTREETSKYSEPILDGKIRQFSFTIDARSIITYPSYPDQLEKGWIEIRGLAWSGRGRVAMVEVSTDAGKSWQRAQLNTPTLDKAHVSFTYLWEWKGQPTAILSRVYDETGYRQPTYRQLIAARGKNTRYHINAIVAWEIGKDGTVLFRPESV